MLKKIKYQGGGEIRQRKNEKKQITYQVQTKTMFGKFLCFGKI